jgi:hypothetical protein
MACTPGLATAGAVASVYQTSHSADIGALRLALACSASSPRKSSLPDRCSLSSVLRLMAVSSFHQVRLTALEFPSLRFRNYAQKNLPGDYPSASLGRIERNSFVDLFRDLLRLKSRFGMLPCSIPTCRPSLDHHNHQRTVRQNRMFLHKRGTARDRRKQMGVERRETAQGRLS